MTHLLTTLAAILGFQIVLTGSSLAQAPPPGGVAGEWLVNANGYTFVMRLSGDPRFSGSLSGLNNDNAVTRIDGQRSGAIAEFTRTNDENDRFQAYRGRIVATEEAKWMFGTFVWQGGEYRWCAVSASLVDPAERRSWSDCKVGWEKGQTGIAQ